ncbi:hypothetical protein HPB47_008042 [Ixodes persulcatus]|uniref:Uncharacterized protein n=1 Tax=Ixodes persulcatus TaxID=34615 RepID=A0AC60P666_IXOPE|nr:hypothetical protein HPB47_008042 [Ixodes persulcatus]
MGSTPLAERVTTSIQHSEIGHQVLSHLKRFITETPEADGSLLELLEEKLQTSGYHQSLQNAIYHRLCQEIEKSELGSDEVPFLEEAQLRWQTNLVRSLKSTAKELGLPLCRKRTVGEQNLIEDRWFDLGQEEIELLAIRPMYSPQDLLDYLLSTTTPREILKVPMFEIPDSLDVDSDEYEAFAQLMAPLCFLYEDVAQMYAVFREMYCRYFHKLTTAVMQMCRCSRLVFALTLLWPIYASFKSIEAQDSAQSERWLKHWVVLGIYLLTDTMLGGSDSGALYDVVKIGLLIWIHVHANQSSPIVYDNFLRPQMARLETVINGLLEKHIILN